MILTDDLFFELGGAIDDVTGTSGQRQHAYSIAQSLAEGYYGTPLEETVFTGTFWHRPFERLQLPHNNIRSVEAVTFVHSTDCDCDVTELSGCAFLIHPETGIIDVRGCGNVIRSGCGCGCWGQPSNALNIRVAYTAGLQDGLATGTSAILMGLTLLADDELKAILNPDALEGGPGNPGVRQFASAGYSETRVPWLRTSLGASPKARKAADLFDSASRQIRALRL